MELFVFASFSSSSRWPFWHRVPGGMDVGRRNVNAAHRALLRHGFSVMSEHVGGKACRRLHFDLLSGDVWLALPETQAEFMKESA